MTAGRHNCALFFAALFAVTLALRLCHSQILWADEDYHLAAGIQTLHGKLLYRDLWYDKPPFAAWVYAAMGALPAVRSAVFNEWPLRLFDALFVLAVSIATWRFARDLWGRREAMLAAGLMAFFLNFDLAAAVMPIAPDMFLLLPHIVAVHCAWKGKPFAAGLWCGTAFLFHTKGVFVLAMCALLAWRTLPALVAGFAIPNAAVLAGLAAAGALPQYFQQVWEWSTAYARSSPEPHALANGLRRTADWMGFHIALSLGAAAFWWENRKRESWWMAAWLALSFAGVALGARFFPRYFLQILPPMVLLAARGASILAGWAASGFVSPETGRDEQRTALGGNVSGGGNPSAPARVPTPPAGTRYRGVSGKSRRGGQERLRHIALAIVAAVALLVPAVRFGPRYATLALDLLTGRKHRWADIALDQDSRAAADLVNRRKHPGDTLFVWGYRPGVFVYTRLPAASRFWDSQPLTGVPADRHLHSTLAVLPEQATLHRSEFAASRPTFVVDSLSLANPRLAMEGYPELRSWLAGYTVVGRTPMSLIYEFTAETPRR